jgi:hypothetical protein
MLWSAEIVLADLIVLCSAGLFVYWIARALLFAHGSEEEIERVLESDLRRGRRFLLTLRILLHSSSLLLAA